jgi:hypothetical protein
MVILVSQVVCEVQPAVSLRLLLIIEPITCRAIAR